MVGFKCSVSSPGLYLGYRLWPRSAAYSARQRLRDWRFRQHLTLDNVQGAAGPFGQLGRWVGTIWASRAAPRGSVRPDHQSGQLVIGIPPRVLGKTAVPTISHDLTDKAIEWP